MKYRCPNCGAYLDPEERCGCLGPVFRRIDGDKQEEINLETFVDILRSVRRKTWGEIAESTVMQ